jgi:diacylglycerol kinase family enzyme
VRVTLIHNPGAGNRSKIDPGKLTKLVRDAGHEVRYQSAKEDWQAALDAPSDLVAVAGGDGTVSRIAKAMAGRATPMTVLPAGTANNIARTLGLTHRPLEELVQGWAQARRMKLDLGMARGPWGERRFIEGVGIGLFPARISHVDRNQTIESLERGDAIVSYALQLLKEELERCRPVHVEASVDGRDVSGDYLLFEALNIPYVGPNLFLAPDSAQGDGHFDLVMVREAERERLRQYLAHWQEDKPRLAVLPSMQGRTLSLEWAGFDVHMDDELCRAPAAGSRIEVGIEAEAVQVLAPAGKQK